MRDNIDAFAQNKSRSLAGHLLVATPAVQGSCFARSVIYLCAHDAAGAMGVIVNYPVENIRLKEVCAQLGISAAPEAGELPVHFGGPVEPNRGFVIHGGGGRLGENLSEMDGIAVTASISALHDMAAGKWSEQGVLALGYAGWAPCQLESEIETGSWIIVPATHQLMFSTANDHKWNVAMSSIGIDLGHLSTHVGHA